MAAGDISKELVADVREELGDSSKTLIKADKLLYDRLAWYQNYLMITKKLSRVKVTYPLITGQSVYPFLEEVVSHTAFWFSDDIACIPVIQTSDTTSGDDARELTLSKSDEFVTGTDFMYSSAFIRPTTAQKISKSVDPIIEDVYYPLLKEYTINYYKNPEPISLLMKQTQEIADALKAVDRAISRTMGTNKLNL